MFSNAALYFAGRPPTRKQLEELPGVTSVDVELDRTGHPARYEVRINRITLTINVMPEGHLAEHLASFCGYLRHVTRDRAGVDVTSVEKKILNTRTVLGCVLKPGMDPEAKAGDALFFLNHLNDGLLFTRDTIFGPDGNPIAGPLAPQRS